MKNSASVAAATPVGTPPGPGNHTNHHRNHRRRRHRRPKHQEGEQNGQKPALRNVVVPLELPPAGYQLLKTMAIQAESPSVADFLLEMIVEECQAFAEAMADTSSPDLRELLTINPREVARL